jgi:hypothetical protein
MLVYLGFWPQTLRGCTTRAASEELDVWDTMTRGQSNLTVIEDVVEAPASGGPEPAVKA